MKKSGAGAVIVLALVMITGLSVMYWKDVGEKLITASTSVEGREVPICSAEKEEPEISLTFDVTGSGESVRKILDILEKQQVKATFFVTGEWVQKFPEDTKRILTAGHDLGNNSENHRQMGELSVEECRKEIMQLHDRIKELTGREMNLFRPPYGEYNNTVIRTAYTCGYYPICWNIDSQDWKDYGADDILKQVTENENLGNGAIIFCHTESKHIADALEKIVGELKGKGYTLVPVSELIYREHYHMEMAGKQISDR